MKCHSCFFRSLMLVIAVVGIHVWGWVLAGERNEELLDFFFQLHLVRCKWFYGETRSFPRKLNVVGLVRETEPENRAWTFWYIWVAWWVHIVLDPNPCLQHVFFFHRGGAFFGILYERNSYFFVWHRFPRFKKNQMHFFPNRLNKNHSMFFSSWICLFLASEKKTEWSLYEIFRKKWSGFRMGWQWITM